MKEVIVVVPCYNEEETLPHIIEALNEVRNRLKSKFLIDFLFVNDGSSDKTQVLLDKAATVDKHVFYREFSKNVGHQSALRAGLRAAVDYDAAIMMDADMQHPPELIDQMLDQWQKGFKIVQMIRKDSSEETGVIRFWIGKLYYQLINWISDLKLDYGASDFRLIDKSVTEIVNASKENNLFLRGYFSWLPASRTTIEYMPNKRIAGLSKYNLKKLLDLALRSVIQFSEKPLRLATIMGLVFAAASFIYGIFLIISHLLGLHTVSGWASLMVVILFCFGINFVLLGIIGNYLAHSINIQKERPEYIIASEKLRFVK